jgi:ABC-type transport system substrate-binding protein
VSSGAYQLKRFQQEGSTFRLQRRRDASFNESDIGIDGITIRRFKRFAGAIKAVERHEIDILPLQSLKLLHQTAPDLHPQQTPFFSESYYLLFLNRKKAPLRDENNCVSLAGAIDYSAISWYLHAGQLEDAPPILEPLAGTALDLKIGCDSRECLDIAQLIGKSVGVDLIHPVLSEKGGKETEGLKHADAFLTQIFFGIGFSRLSRYFHSEGRNNPFGYANPKVDELLKELDRTSDMRLRQSIAERVLSDILADFGVILLAPCYQYILSPLEIQFDENLNGLFDLVQNMTRLVVERHGCR